MSPISLSLSLSRFSLNKHKTKKNCIDNRKKINLFKGDERAVRKTTTGEYMLA